MVRKATKRKAVKKPATATATAKPESPPKAEPKQLSASARLSALEAKIKELEKLIVGLGGHAAHVNAGPTTHTNVPGHADFTRSRLIETVTLPAHELSVTLADGLRLNFADTNPGVFIIEGIRVIRK